MTDIQDRVAPNKRMHSPRFSNIQKQYVRNFKTKKGTPSKPSKATESKFERIESETSKTDPYAEVIKHQERDPFVIEKYILYTVLAVPAFFTGCAIWQYENVRKILKNPRSHMKHTEKNEKALGFREQLNVIWNQIPPGRKLVLEIIGVNVAVFMLFKVKALYPIMTRYFVCMPTKAHSILGSTLSAFSHYSGLHLFLNMYVLWSFSGPVCSLFGKEQYLAVYLAGGTTASLTSCLYRIVSGRMIPSVGASGAILSMIAIVCLEFPDSRVSIAFVDMIFPHSFSAKSAILGVMILDCIGIARGWRFLDHAAHLGGALFGLFYIKYGKHYFEAYKRVLLQKYHEIRGKKK